MTQPPQSANHSGQATNRAAQVLIRPAVPDDASAMATVFIRAWQQAYPGIVPDAVLASLDYDRTAGWLAELIVRRTEGETDVAEHARHLVGFVRYGTPPEQQGSGYVFGLYVDPGAAGQGTGQALLQHAERRLREAGCQAVALHVFEANQRARRLYSRAGFRPDGTSRVEAEFQATEVRLIKALSSAARS